MKTTAQMIMKLVAGVVLSAGVGAGVGIGVASSEHFDKKVPFVQIARDSMSDDTKRTYQIDMRVISCDPNKGLQC